MYSYLRTCILAFAAVPAFALAVGDMNGTWKVNGEASWMELSKNPQFAAMPKEQLAMMKPMMIAQFAQLTFVIKDGVTTITKPDGTTQEGGKIKDWTSTGPTTATATNTSQQGQDDKAENSALIEKPDATTLRMTVEQQGQKVTMVMTAVPAASAPTAPTPAK